MTRLLRQPFRYASFNATMWLIAANVLVFAFTYLFPRSLSYLAMNPQAVLSGWIWQPFTYMFAHAGFSHILFNMIGLLFFGSAIEREVGSKEFLLFYLLTGFLAGLFSFAVYVLTGTWGAWLLGASGAVYAVLLAFAVLFPSAEIYVWGLLPVRAPLLVAGYTAIELFSQFSGARSGVAHLTHLAGFGFAWLYFLVRFGLNPWRRLFPRR
jgi:membrane associated rhomboid family serine protease